MKRLFVDYLQIRDLIPEGAVALYRGDWGNCQHAVVMAGSRSPYVHAGLLSWETPYHDETLPNGKKKRHYEPPRLVLLDTIQRVGARRVPFLSREVRKHPNQWDVFEVTDPDYDGRAATNAMRRREAQKYPYGWGAFFSAARLHYPILRWFPPRDLSQDEDALRHQMCSGAVSQDMREAGKVDPVPDLKDRYTAPGDLLRGGVLRYVCTPIWVPRKRSTRVIVRPTHGPGDELGVVEVVLPTVQRTIHTTPPPRTQADEALHAMAMMDTLFAACGHPPVKWVTEPSTAPR